MITESHRQQLLRLLILARIDPQEILQKYKEQTGKELSLEELDQLIAQLRRVQGV